MKTMRISLILTVAFLMAASFSACKKDAEPEPELSARVVGNYTLTRIIQNGQAFTVNAQTTGKAIVSRESETTVNFALDVKSTNDPSSTILGTTTGVTVQDAGNGKVNLVKDGSNFATGENNTLTVNINDTSGGGDYQLVFTR